MRSSAAIVGLVAVLGVVGVARAQGRSEAEREAQRARDIEVQVEDAERLPASSGPHGAAAPEITPEDTITPMGPFQAALEDGVETDAVPGVKVRLYWKRGINYQVDDEVRLFDLEGHLDGRIGLRLQVDTAGYASDGIKNANGGIDLRRFYFYTTGEWDYLYPILFAVDFGIERGSFFVDDAYIWLTDLPYVGTFKFGQFNAPMGLAQLTGSGTRPFMEIGTPGEAFSPGSKAGFQIANDAYDRRLTWQVGWFADTQSVPVGDASDSVSRVVGRLTGLPIFERQGEGQKLLHLGISTSFVFADRERVRYQSRPESFLAPEIVDTGDVQASAAALLGLEVAWVDGPLSFQGELLGSSVRSDETNDPLFYGLYGEVSYFLTGESRPFNRASAVFGNVVPKRSFHWDDPRIGAWEVAGRLSWTDLSEGTVRGGQVFTAMSGINWYLNRYARIMFEYGVSYATDGPQDGSLQIFQARFQVNI